MTQCSEMSRTLSFTSRKSTVSIDYMPPIDVGGGDYIMGLINFQTYNTIPNVDESNNMFYFNDKQIEIPVGSYELDDLAKYLKTELEKYNVVFNMWGNNNTLGVHIHSMASIDFTKPRNISSLLGWSPQIIPADIKAVSEYPANIMRVNGLRIECNVVSGSYDNGRSSHVIHEFFPGVPPGFKIIESPVNVIYMPINVTRIDNITLRVTDENGQLVNFRGEQINIRLDLKRA
jgi:hypothetical protein